MFFVYHSNDCSSCEYFSLTSFDSRKKKYNNTGIQAAVCHRPPSFSLSFGHFFNSLQRDALCLYKLVWLVWTTTFPPVRSQLWTCISRVITIPTIRWSFYNSVPHIQSCLLFSKMIPASAVFPHRWLTVGGVVEIIWGVRSWGSSFGGRRLWKQWCSCRHGCWSRM